MEFLPKRVIDAHHSSSPSWMSNLTDIHRSADVAESNGETEDKSTCKERAMSGRGTNDNSSNDYDNGSSEHASAPSKIVVGRTHEGDGAHGS